MRRTKQKGNNAMLVALGTALRQLRINRAMTQKDVSGQSNLNRTYITDVEAGRRNLSFLSLVRICAALETPISELLSQVDVGKFTESEPE